MCTTRRHVTGNPATAYPSRFDAVPRPFDAELTLRNRANPAAPAAATIVAAAKTHGRSTAPGVGQRGGLSTLNESVNTGSRSPAASQATAPPARPTTAPNPTVAR